MPDAILFKINLNAGGELHVHERIDESLGRLRYLDETCVGALFELLTAVLVLVHRAENRDDLILRGKPNGTGYFGTAAICDLDDLRRSRIDERVLIALESDSHFLIHCHLGFPPY